MLECHRQNDLVATDDQAVGAQAIHITAIVQEAVNRAGFSGGAISFKLVTPEVTRIGN
jgi:hypothetical protein